MTNREFAITQGIIHFMFLLRTLHKMQAVDWIKDPNYWNMSHHDFHKALSSELLQRDKHCYITNGITRILVKQKRIKEI